MQSKQNRKSINNRLNKGIVRAVILKGIEEQLKQSNAEYKVFSDVESNPWDITVEKVADWRRSTRLI